MKAIAIAVALTGCVTDDELELTETEQDLSWMTWVIYGTSDGSELDMGPTSDRTCFLTGIRGSLAGNVDVGVIRVGEGSQERWKVRTRSTYAGENARVMVGCIKATAGRVDMHVVDHAYSSEQFQTVPDRTRRECFLRRLWTQGSYYGDADVRISHGSTDWSLSIRNPGSSGASGATAVCVDIPDTSTEPTRTPVADVEGKDFVKGALPGDVVVEKLFDNDGSWMCGLTNLTGRFDESWEQPGAEVFLNSNGNWVSRIADGRRLATRCVR